MGILPDGAFACLVEDFFICNKSFVFKNTICDPNHNASLADPLTKEYYYIL